MMCTRQSGQARLSEGSILIEVMVAVVLLGVLIVPLATSMQSALGGAEAVQEQATRITASSFGSGEQQAWEWGPAVASARWTAGPVLHLGIGAIGECGGLVGMWVNGWFLGELSVSSGGSLCVDPRRWLEHVGAGLVVRVRRPGEAWGPPWRTVVPDAYCDYLPSAVQAIQAVDAGSADGLQIVAHVPALANPSLEVSGSRLRAVAAPKGMPFFLPAMTCGRYDVIFEGQTQSLLTNGEGGRDVYF